MTVLRYLQGWFYNKKSMFCIRLFYIGFFYIFFSRMKNSRLKIRSLSGNKRDFIHATGVSYKLFGRKDIRPIITYAYYYRRVYLFSD